MALGRAEALHEQSGQQVNIVRWNNHAREHDAWVGNPAWNKESKIKLHDSSDNRGYISRWEGNRVIYNMGYKARAGKIHLTDFERSFNTLSGRYAIISPRVKINASPNKDWGAEKWEQVIRDFPIPVYQCLSVNDESPIDGALGIYTRHFRFAAAMIERAAIVLTNEGGAHHMAASFGRPAVVIFGSFVPPQVTGYDFHVNIATPDEHAYCGNFSPCAKCRKNLDSIKPEYVREKALEVLNV